MALVPASSSGGGGSISGVTVTGTAASGQVPVASSSSAGTWSYPPGFEIGYDQITAGVNITGTSQAAANTIITCSAHTFDGSPVILEFFTPQLACDTGNLADSVHLDLWEGATDIAILVNVRSAQTTNQFYLPTYAAFRFTPTAGSHTYLIKGWTSATTGTPSVQAGTGTGGGNVPAFARFVKV